MLCTECLPRNIVQKDCTLCFPSSSTKVQRTIWNQEIFKKRKRNVSVKRQKTGKEQEILTSVGGIGKDVVHGDGSHGLQERS
mgnify:CR=1 FL=1